MPRRVAEGGTRRRQAGAPTRVPSVEWCGMIAQEGQEWRLSRQPPAQPRPMAGVGGACDPIGAQPHGIERGVQCDGGGGASVRRSSGQWAGWRQRFGHPYPSCPSCLGETEWPMGGAGRPLEGPTRSHSCFRGAQYGLDTLGHRYISSLSSSRAASRTRALQVKPIRQELLSTKPHETAVRKCDEQYVVLRSQDLETLNVHRVQEVAIPRVPTSQCSLLC